MFFFVFFLLFLTLQRVFKRDALGINAGRDVTVKDVRMTHECMCLTIKNSADGTQQHPRTRVIHRATEGCPSVLLQYVTMTTAPDGGARG